MKFFVLLLLFSLVSFANENNSELPIAPGSGTAKGLMGVIMVPANPLQKTLPKGLTLAPELIQNDGTYPAAVFVGQQENLKIEIDNKQVLVEKLYNEATLTFTVVGPYNSKDRYTYTSKIVVDSVPAMLMGRSLGYPKRMATIDVSESSFSARFQHNVPVMDVEMTEVKDFDRAAFKKNFESLSRNINPTINHTLFGWICYDFKWDFGAGEAYPVTANVSYFDAFAGKQLSGSFQSPSLDKSLFGSVKIKSFWRMSNYRRCD